MSLISDVLASKSVDMSLTVIAPILQSKYEKATVAAMYHLNFLKINISNYILVI